MTPPEPAAGNAVRDDAGIGPYVSEFVELTLDNEIALRTVKYGCAM